MAKIEMDLAEWNGHQDKLKAAEARIIQLEKDMQERVFAEDASNSLKAATQLTRHALTVVRFAVGNLDPVSIANWPWKTLYQISDLIPALADHTADDIGLAIELKAFARECEQHDRRRAIARTLPPPAPADDNVEG